MLKPRFSSAVATANSASSELSGLSVGPYATGMKPRWGGSSRSLAIDSYPLAGGRLHQEILERAGYAILSPDVRCWHIPDSSSGLAPHPALGVRRSLPVSLN